MIKPIKNMIATLTFIASQLNNTVYYSLTPYPFSEK